MGRIDILNKIATYILTGGRRTTASGTRDVLNEMANSYVSAIYDTAANFTSNNPILETKQHGVETNGLTTSPKYKIGDGVTAWNSLPYATSSSVPTLQEVINIDNTVDEQQGPSYGVLAKSVNGLYRFTVSETSVFLIAETPPSTASGVGATNVDSYIMYGDGAVEGKIRVFEDYSSVAHTTKVIIDAPLTEITGSLNILGQIQSENTVNTIIVNDISILISQDDGGSVIYLTTNENYIKNSTKNLFDAPKNNFRGEINVLDDSDNEVGTTDEHGILVKDSILTATPLFQIDRDNNLGKYKGIEIATVNDIPDLSGYEETTNKSSSYTASSTTTYANTKALVDGLATKLTASSNLSDLANIFTARNNLLIKDLFITTGNQSSTSATAADVSGLVISASANKRYKITGFIHFGCSGVGGTKFAITYPSGASLHAVFTGWVGNSSTATWQTVTASGVLSGVFSSAISANAFVLVSIDVELSSTSGNVQIQFAPTTGGQTSTIYQLGTHLTSTQIN